MTKSIGTTLVLIIYAFVLQSCIFGIQSAIIQIELSDDVQSEISFNITNGDLSMSPDDSLEIKSGDTKTAEVSIIWKGYAQKVYTSFKSSTYMYGGISKGQTTTASKEIIAGIRNKFKFNL